MKFKEHVQTFESFRESLNAPALNEAEEKKGKKLKKGTTPKNEKKLEPVYTPLIFMIGALPFKSFDLFKNFILSLKSEDFKKLYPSGDAGKFLADILRWSGIESHLVYDDYTKQYYVYPKTRDKSVIRLEDVIDNNSFPPFTYGGSEVKDGISFKDAEITCANDRDLYFGVDIGRLEIDGFNSITGNIVTIEDILNGDELWNMFESKRSDKLYKDLVETVKNKKPKVKNLEKYGLKANTIKDLINILNGLSEDVKKYLSKTKVVNLEDGNLTYSEDAKKLIDDRLNKQVQDTGGEAARDSTKA